MVMLQASYGFGTFGTYTPLNDLNTRTHQQRITALPTDPNVSALLVGAHPKKHRGKPYQKNPRFSLVSSHMLMTMRRRKVLITMKKNDSHRRAFFKHNRR